MSLSRPEKNVLAEKTETTETGLDFASLRTREDVAALLKVSDQGLRHLLYGIKPATLYRTFEIPKKSGGIRRIVAPVPRLKTLQRRLLKILEDVYPPKTSAHGFVKSRGICTNANIHLRRKNVLNLDLKDFFPSINFGRVRGVFLASPYNCPREVATVLARICCFNNELPQGAPTSPIVSNMICARLDSHLAKLAATHHCRYSRYADDITFSTNQRQFPRAIAELITEGETTTMQLGLALTRTIEKNGFQINNDKVRLRTTFERQEVTGLTVNKKLNVERRFIREVRAMLHNWREKGIAVCQKKFAAKHRRLHPHRTQISLFKEAVKGKIEFIGQVRGKTDALYLKYLKELKALAPELLSNTTLRNLVALDDQAAYILDQLWVVDATKADDSDARQGTAFYLEEYGLVTCAHVLFDDPTCLVEVYRRDETERQPAGIKLHNTILDLAVLSLKSVPETRFTASTRQIKIGDKIWLAGFPSWGRGHSGIVEPGLVTGSFNDVDGSPRLLINANIASGNSGGPVFDESWNVVGVAAKGVNKDDKQEVHEVIPISSLKIIKTNYSRL